ncbi:MAG: ribonuclease P protein component [bacterium]
MDYKFTKKERLLQTKDFQNVYTSGKRYHSKNLILFVIPTSNSLTRIGFSISRKKVGKAVKRNRIKRLLREAYRLNKNSLIGGVDLVVVLKNESVELLNFKDVERELLSLFKRAGLNDKKKPTFIN